MQERPGQSSISPELSKNIPDRMGTCIFVSDPETGEILYMNEAMKAQYGFGGGVLGKKCWEVLQPAFTKPCAFCPIPRLTFRGPPVVWEEQSRLNRRHYRNSSSLIEWENGKAAHLQESVDLSDLKASEEGLKRKAAREEFIAAISKSFITTGDLSTLIHNALMMTGLFMQVSRVSLARRNEEEGRLDFEYEWRSNLYKAQRRQSCPFGPGDFIYDTFLIRGEVVLVCNDTKELPELAARLDPQGIRAVIYMPVQVYGSFWGILILDQSKEIRFWDENDVQLVKHIGSTIAGLITRSQVEEELIAAKVQAEQSSLSKSNFLSRMSHEMRTPMNAIIGMTTIAQSAGGDLEKMNSCLSKINEASVHLLGVINDILDMSKIEAGKFEISPLEFDFQKMLSRIIGVMNFRIEEKKQQLILNVDSKIPALVIADEQRLAQVLTNLLGNAVKFTPGEGIITLSVELLASQDRRYSLRFSVADTGIGIAEEQKGKLFSLFEQADGTIARRFGGTGLGLAISKNIVELMGGRIWVESVLGQGSTFIFEVEVERGGAPEPEEALEPGEAAQDDDFSGRSILLAEDVEINREIVLSLLEDTGLVIDCAENGLQAVELFQASPDKYSLVFMDIHMPEMDGYEATRRIRALEAQRPKEASGDIFPGVPIVAMTANVFKEDVEKCLAAGMNDHLGKPIDFEELFKRLRQYLRAKA